MNGRDALVIDAVRTPRGKGSPRGALHPIKPVELVSQLLGALAERQPSAPAAVDDVVLGCVTQVGDQGANIAKTATLFAGWPDRVPGMTVNRYCASGLDAIGIAAARIGAGMCEVVCAGGVESMSRVPIFGDDGAWYHDPEVAAATRFVHMGVAADLLATLAELTHVDLDLYAVESHRRAAAAHRAGHFAGAMVPVRGADGGVALDHDELVRPQATVERFSDFDPLFEPADSAAVLQAAYPGVELRAMHTVATAPGTADGAAVAVIASGEGAARLGARPRGRIRAVASASVEPVQMLHGNLAATARALEQAGITLEDIDLFEVNESFAAVPLHFMRELDLEPDRVNVSGGAIAMGHPMGATGGMLVATLIDDLERLDRTLGVVSICGGAGVATAMVIERL